MRCILALATCLVIAGCAVPSPAVRAFGDQKAWLLLEPMRYQIGGTSETIVVPAGFVTDYASIPPAAWSLMSPHGQYSRAAVVHDYLYWTQQCTKKQADNLLVIAMRESNVPGGERIVIDVGLALGGWSGWSSNRNEITAGLPKVVPKHFWSSMVTNPNGTWAELRSQLVAAGVKDPAWGPRPPYCAIGNDDEVPL